MDSTSLTTASVAKDLNRAWATLFARLVLGLRTRDALIALGCVLVVVTFGHLLHDALFSFSGHVIPRLALLLFLLWCECEDDRFSIDYLLARQKEVPGDIQRSSH